MINGFIRTWNGTFSCSSRHQVKFTETCCSGERWIRFYVSYYYGKFIDYFNQFCNFITSLLHLNSLFPNLEKAQAIFTPVMNGSVNIMSIMIAFLVARNIAISYEQDDLLCGLTAIGAFFIVYTPYQMIDGQAFLTT